MAPDLNLDRTPGTPVTNQRITFRGGTISGHFSQSSALETCLDYRCRLGLEPGLVAPPDALLDYFSRAGVEHERTLLDRLEAEGRQITRIGRQPGDADKSRQTELTLAAMRRGDPLISGGYLQAGDRLRTLAAASAVLWRLPRVPIIWGEPDLLQRVDDPDDPSAIGPWYYQPADIKSSRHARLPGSLQVAFYGLLLNDAQDVRPDRGAILPRPLEPAGAMVWEFFNLDPLYGQLHDFMWSEYWRIVTSDPHDLAADDALSTPLAEVWGKREGLIRDDLATCDIAILPGLRREPRRHFRRVGMQRIGDLAAASPELVRSAVGTGLRESGALRLQAQARSCVQGSPHWRNQDAQRRWLSEPTRNSALALLRDRASTTIVLDLENDPLTDCDYLYGLSVHRPGDDAHASRLQHIWAQTPDEAGTVAAARELLSTIEAIAVQNGAVTVVHYGHVEASRLLRLSERHPEALPLARVEAILGRYLDLHPLLTAHLLLPVTSYSLKEVAPLIERLPAPGGPGHGHRWLALSGLEDLAADLRRCGWQEAEIPAAQAHLQQGALELGMTDPVELLAPSAGMSVVWYERWRLTGQLLWRHLITTYNTDDLRATFAVLRYLRDLADCPSRSEGTV